MTALTKDEPRRHRWQTVTFVPQKVLIVQQRLLPGCLKPGSAVGSILQIPLKATPEPSIGYAWSFFSCFRQPGHLPGLHATGLNILASLMLVLPYSGF